MHNTHSPTIEEAREQTAKQLRFYKNGGFIRWPIPDLSDADFGKLDAVLKAWTDEYVRQGDRLVAKLGRDAARRRR